jgi:DNA primase
MKSGLLIRSDKGIFDRFRSRIMFPIFHQSGRVIAFGGRDFEKNDVAKYLNSPETSLYQKSNTLYGLHITKEDIRKSDYAILVEGYMDFLQLYQAGIKSVVSVSGTSLTRNHANMLSKLVNKIILLYDGDSAGGNAVIRAGFILYRAGMDAYVVRPPDQLDPDDWLLEKGSSEIQLALENPKPFLDFHIEFHQATNLKGTDRRDYLHNLISNINDITDTIIKNELIKDISEKFKISEIDLLEILNSKKSYTKEVITNDIDNDIEFTSKVHRAELELTKILIHATKTQRKELKKLIDIELFSHELLIKIVSKIVTDESAETSKLIEHFPKKMERELISKLLIDEKKDTSSEQIVIDCLKTLKSVPIKNKINELRAVVQKKELSGYNPNEELKEIMRLQNQLNGNQK